MKKRRFFSAVVAGIMMLSLLAGNVAYAATDSGGDSGNAGQTSNDTGTQDTNDDNGTVNYAADPQAAANADSGSTIVQDDTVTTDDVASSIVMDDGSELTSLMAAPMMLGASAGQTVQLDYTHIISYTNDAGEGNGAHVFRFTTDGVNYYYAYCTRPDMPGPDPGTYPTVALTDPLRLKILYYGFGGPGDITGYLGSQDERYIVTHFAMTYARFKNFDHVDWSAKNAEVRDLVAKIQALPDVKSGVDVALDKNSADAVMDGDIQKSGTFTVTAGEGLTYSGLPSQVSLVLENGTVNPANLNKGDAFHLEAPSNIAQLLGTNVVTMNIRGTGATYRLIQEGSRQEINGLIIQPDSAETNLTVTFINTGKVKMGKTSERPEITDGNDCYDLSGAVFGIFSDAACTNQVGSMTTKADGSTDGTEMVAGTYYVKETEAPLGFYKSDEVFTVDLGPGQTATVTLADKPLYDTLKITKKDARRAGIDENLSEPEGEGTLEGAVFLVEYFAGKYDSVDKLPTGKVNDYTDHACKKYWLLKSVYDSASESYTVLMDDAHKAGGDDFYSFDGKVGIPLGTVCITEVTPPTGYLLPTDPVIDFRTLTAAKGSEEVDGYPKEGIDAMENPFLGGFKIQKWDNELLETTPQGDATLQGANIEVTNESSHSVIVNGKEYANGQVCFTGVTDQNGTFESAANVLPYGNYVWRENDATDMDNNGAPDGYKNEGQLTGSFEIREDGKVVDMTSSDKADRNNVKRGGVVIAKWSLETDRRVTETDQVTDSHVIDATTFLKTAAAASGISKRQLDVAEGTADPQGSASFAGADIEIYNESAHHVLVDGKVYEPGEKIATVTTDGNGLWISAKDWLPYGTYKAVEVKAPQGYLLEGNLETTFSIRYDLRQIEELNPDGIDEDAHPYHYFVNLDNASTGNIYKAVKYIDDDNLAPKDYTAIKDQVKRGDVKFVKIGDGDSDRLAYVPFLITSKTTGESHIVVTDANGQVNTSLIEENGLVKDLGMLNTNDAIMVPKDKSSFNKNGSLLGDVSLYTLDQALLDKYTEFDAEPSAGVWFSGEADVSYDYMKQLGFVINKDKGALPYDTYTLQEIQCRNNSWTAEDEKKDSSHKAGTPKYDLQKITFKVYKDHTTVDLGTITDDIYTIKTTATDELTGGHIAEASDNVTINDKVEISGLMPDDTYRLYTTLVDSATGENIVTKDGAVSYVTDISQVNGKDVGVTVPITFNAAQLHDGGSLAGHSVTVEEVLKDSKGDTLVSHTLSNMEDEEAAAQTVAFPSVDTKAEDALTKTNVTMASDDMKVTDNVTYTNLTAGRDYTVTGVLMDKETGKEALDDNGNKVTAEAKFRVEKSSGTVTVTYEFSGVKCAGKTLVSFETLSWNGHELAVHSDIHDDDQTVYVPAVTTNAKDKASGTQKADPAKETVIVDTVTYSNLFIGRNYTVKGVLMDKDTKQPLKSGGQEVTAEMSFRPEKADGSVELSFTLDTTELADKSAVVFEKLYMGDQLVASDEDIDNADQTVEVNTPETPTPTPDSKPETPSVTPTPSVPTSGSTTTTSKTTVTTPSASKTTTTYGDTEKGDGNITTSPVKTGDASQLLIWIIILAASGSIVYLIARKGKRK
jgi:hypothetical protein